MSETAKAFKSSFIANKATSSYRVYIFRIICSNIRPNETNWHVVAPLKTFCLTGVI